MNDLNVVIVGSGMYVTGKGTQEYGTVLPAALQHKKEKNLKDIYLISTDPQSVKSAKAKTAELARIMNVKADVRYFPEGNKKDNQAYKKVFRDIKKPACAIICVPDNMHEKIAASAINEGLHTLVVKPLCPTVREVKKLVNIQKCKKVYCAVEFHKRFDFANIMMKNILESGKIGDPLYFLVEYSQRKDMPLRRFRKWVKNTNIFQYLGIHYIDIIQFVTGARPLRVMATGQKNWLKSKGLDAYDAIEAAIEWGCKNGKKFTSHILTNWIDPESTSAMSDQKIKIIGTKGRFESDQKKRGIVIISDDGGIEEPNPYFCKAYKTGESFSYYGYGIDSIKQFIQDAGDVESGRISISSLEGKRATFKSSLYPTAILEAASQSLKKNNIWVKI